LTLFADSFKGSPFEGYYTADKEKVRVAVNTWIRSSGAFDGVIDFDEVVKDPSRPTYIQAAYDKGIIFIRRTTVTRRWQNLSILHY
jgi:hypothetical protein